MNCLIIGSNKESCKPLEKIIKQSGYFKIVSSSGSLSQAENMFPKNKPNVIFIDATVSMNQANGFISYLNNNKPHVIAVSSIAEISKINFGFEISDFILKPFSNVQLRRVVNKIILTDGNNNKDPNEGSFIFVKVNRAFEKIATTDINYVQALSDYVRIFTADKVFTTYSTMKDMLSKLPEKDFIRVHRSYIVRIDAITQFQDGFLSIGDRLIPIGRLYKKDLIERLNIL